MINKFIKLPDYSSEDIHNYKSSFNLRQSRYETIKQIGVISVKFAKKLVLYMFFAIVSCSLYAFDEFPVNADNKTTIGDGDSTRNHSGGYNHGSGGHGHGGSGSAHQIELYNVSSGATGFHMDKHGVNTSVVLYQAGPISINSWLKGSNQITTADEKPLFPRELYNFSETIELRTQKLWALASIGSISDKPFNSVDELMYGAFAMYDILDNRQHSFFVGGFYSSVFRVPGLPDIALPLAVYQYRSPNFSFMGPFPFALDWKINNSLSYSYSFDMDKQVMYLKYRHSPQITIRTEASYTQESILIADRQNRDEIKWFENGKAGLRVSYSPTPLFSVSTFGGTSFMGRFYDAESPFSTKTDIQDLENTYFIDLNTRFSW